MHDLLRQFGSVPLALAADDPARAGAGARLPTAIPETHAGALHLPKMPERAARARSSGPHRRTGGNRPAHRPHPRRGRSPPTELPVAPPAGDVLLTVRPERGDSRER